MTRLLTIALVLTTTVACGKKDESTEKTKAGEGGSADKSATGDATQKQAGEMACPPSLTGSETINRTIPKGCKTTVTDAYMVDGGTLTIEEGATLAFADGAYLSIGASEAAKLIVQGTNDSDDIPMAVVVHAYAPPSTVNPRGRYTCFIPGMKQLYDGECPYGEIPLVDYHWKPVTTTFLTGNFIHNLISPQRFLNKRMSQFGEQSNASM